MNTRQKLQVLLILFLTLLSFATYSRGSTAWLQFLSVLVFLTFSLVFDCLFVNDSSFLFDPDADNWRRKTEALGA